MQRAGGFAELGGLAPKAQYFRVRANHEERPEHCGLEDGAGNRPQGSRASLPRVVALSNPDEGEHCEHEGRAEAEGWCAFERN